MPYNKYKDKVKYFIYNIVRASSDNTIDVEDIKTENGQSYLNVVPSGWLDVAEGFKYPAICVYVPNYRSLAQNYLQVRAK